MMPARPASFVLLQLAPSWPKAWYRQASALQALQQHAAAAEALQQAYRLTPVGSQEVGWNRP
jgi:predicted TPR repeat methyltransferase